MTTLNVTQTREKLQSFDLRGLFVEALGWNRPPRGLAATTWDEQGLGVTRTPIAELAGVVVFEITTASGEIPDEALRRAIHAAIVQYQHEHLLVFLAAGRRSSLWYWVKRDGGKQYPRRHTYVAGQPGDLLIAKLSAMFVDISELDASGNLRLTEAITRVRQALDVEPVTKRFFGDFQRLHGTLLAAIAGITDERDRRWYASVLLNRLMFVYFLQRRGFLAGGDYRYLQGRLEASQATGPDRYYGEFLQALFFEGFAKPEPERDAQAQARIGAIRYLNGGLFLPHPVEQRNPRIAVPDQVFAEIFALFEGYDWVLDDSPSGNEREINPAVLGYIFEKYINQKAFGAYYTRSEITEYLCEQTIHRLVLDRVNETLAVGAKPYETVGDVLLKPTAKVCRMLLIKILPDLRLIDPACGSGAFLVAAMRTLIAIYSGLLGHAKTLGDSTLNAWLKTIEQHHPNLGYFIKKQIIVNNLYGVDIMAEAVEIARLRLFLALVASAARVEDLEPLPNIDFNILAGNALIGLLRVDEGRANAKHQAVQQLNMFASGKQESYRQVVAEKNRLVTMYRNAADKLRSVDLGALRDEIQRQRKAAAEILDAVLLDDFQALKIQYEQATWDAGKGKEGKPKKRPLNIDDIHALQPFHWGYEFDEVMNERGGFDAIIANPPWETFKPYAKEFFTDFSDVISKKKMSIEDFEAEQNRLLTDPEISEVWLKYLNRFPHQNLFFRTSPQYAHQTPIINNKRIVTDINLYKLFVEQCFNLLRDNGLCGIVVPSGIYSDLGTKGLRELLFESVTITGLFCFENRKAIFEGVHSRFKFVVLSYLKSGKTLSFPVAFMRHNVVELNCFPRHESLFVSVDLIHRLSPDTLSIMEFKSELDIRIAEKILKHPLLGESVGGSWAFDLSRELHMTDDSSSFKLSSAKGLISLYEGKMIWQFEHQLAQPRYWIALQDVRKSLLGRQIDAGQVLSYQRYRLGYRAVASSTNERTLISTVLPANIVTGHSLNVIPKDIGANNHLFLTALFNSFVLDYSMRQRVAANITQFFLYQLPVPRLTEADPRFAPIVERAAKLICTTPEYDALAAEVGLGDHSGGATDPVERNKLRAALDGLVAHLYELSESELTHILGTFPLVEQAQKDAVLTAYRAFAPHPDDTQVAKLIAAGESDRVEFKESAVWNAHTSQKDNGLTAPIIKAIAAFLNSREGGSIFIGVNAAWHVVGIAADVAAASHKGDLDNYERTVRTALSAKLGGQNSPHYSFSFHTIGSHQVLRIAVSPAPAPAYVDGDLSIRDGGGKKKLSAQEAVGYIGQRWPS